MKFSELNIGDWFIFEFCGKDVTCLKCERSWDRFNSLNVAVGVDGEMWDDYYLHDNVEVKLIEKVI